MDGEKKKLGVLENKINGLIKSVGEMKKINLEMRDEIKELNLKILAVNHKIPERKSGWFRDYWQMPLSTSNKI